MAPRDPSRHSEHVTRLTVYRLKLRDFGFKHAADMSAGSGEVNSCDQYLQSSQFPWFNISLPCFLEVLVRILVERHEQVDRPVHVHSRRPGHPRRNLR